MTFKNKMLVKRGAFLHGVKGALQRAGLDVGLVTTRSDPFRRLTAILKMHDVDYVLDVGANRGQFASDLFAAGYDGTILSFEPIPEMRALLTKAAAAYGRRWLVGPSVALGDEETEASFHLAANTASSSLLELTDGLIEIAPQTARAGTIKVPVRRLDQMLSELGLASRRLFLKMDTQGSELRILRGAERALPLIAGVMSEMSVAKLYNHQPLFREIDAHLVDQGFELVDIVPGFRDPGSLRLLQFDGVYLRAAQS